MPNLSSKELTALEDQIGFEKVLSSKYQTAVQEATDPQLKTSYQRYADHHQKNANCLLNFLK